NNDRYAKPKDRKDTKEDSDEEKTENEDEIDAFMELLDRKESIDQKSKSVPPPPPSQDTSHAATHPKEQDVRVQRMLSPELRSMAGAKQKVPAIQPLDATNKTVSDPQSASFAQAKSIGHQDRENNNDRDDLSTTNER
ncbi:mucin-associated surface protein (MASP), partial [Reticulomyxa filosa]